MSKKIQNSGTAKTLVTVALLAVIVLIMPGCATKPGLDEPEALAEYQERNDPFEPLNRATFSFNDGFNTVVLKPLAHGYRFLLPEPLRDGVHNALLNLRSPMFFANNLLQGKPGRAGNTLVRLIVNSTIGIGGLFDVATKIGITEYREDFGQTLATWGIGEGFYIIAPVLGPTTLRDGIGIIADIAMDPFTWILRAEDAEYLGYIRVGVEITDFMERNMDTLDELEEGSIDYYAALRSLYRQVREEQISDGEIEPDDAFYDAFDEFDEFDAFDEADEADEIDGVDDSAPDQSTQP